MTDQVGTSLVRFKTALITAIQARQTGIANYDSPTQASDLMGTDGSGVGVWWLDDTEAEIQVNVLTGGTMWWDEIVTPTLVVQCIGVTTDDTQAVLDARAAVVLGHAVAVLASDPSVGLSTNADSRIIRAVPEGWTYTTGVDSQNQRGARYELRIQLEARITVENQ